MKENYLFLFGKYFYKYTCHDKVIPFSFQLALAREANNGYILFIKNGSAPLDFHLDSFIFEEREGFHILSFQRKENSSIISEYKFKLKMINEYTFVGYFYENDESDNMSPVVLFKEDIKQDSFKIKEFLFPKKDEISIFKDIDQELWRYEVLKSKVEESLIK